MARTFKPADKPMTARQYHLYGALMIVLFPVYDHLGKVGIAAVVAALGLLSILFGFRDSRSTATSKRSKDLVSKRSEEQ